MKKFVLGAIFATVVILLYVYRKRIFVFAQDKPGASPKTSFAKTSASESKAIPGTAGQELGAQIASMMSLRANETLGTQDDTMLDSRKFAASKKILKPEEVQDFDLAQAVINRSILYPKGVKIALCDVCLVPMGTCACGCGCPDQFDVQ